MRYSGTRSLFFLELPAQRSRCTCHSATQVSKQNSKVARSGGQIIQGPQLVQRPLDHCIIIHFRRILGQVDYDRLQSKSYDYNLIFVGLGSIVVQLQLPVLGVNRIRINFSSDYNSPHRIQIRLELDCSSKIIPHERYQCGPVQFPGHFHQMIGLLRRIPSGIEK